MHVKDKNENKKIEVRGKILWFFLYSIKNRTLRQIVMRSVGKKCNVLRKSCLVRIVYCIRQGGALLSIEYKILPVITRH